MTREEMAVHLMAGLLANPNIDTLHNMAEDAVIALDELMAALASSNEAPPQGSEHQLSPKRPTAFVKGFGGNIFDEADRDPDGLGDSGY